MKDELQRLRKELLFRTFRTITSSCSTTVKYKGKELIMLASNNYFGLNTNPRVISAAKKALSKYGTGNMASRLVVNLDLHNKLEQKLAKYKKCQSSLVYSSGFAANLGILSAIAGKEHIIISDELNHASIIDGCRLSKADVKIYKHCNLENLEEILRKFSNKKKIVVTDSIFSMDGDLAPIKKIINLKKKYDFMLMVDNAHSTGIIDTNFKGIDIHMGTLSKVLASQGGFVAGKKGLIDFLRNKSRSFIYSTGLSPSDTAAAIAALEIINKNKNLKNNLLKNADYLRSNLIKKGFIVIGDFQIISILIADIKKVMTMQKLLENEGIFITGIRPLTASPRLRISLMVNHTKAQLDRAIYAIEKVGAKIGLVPRVRR